MNYRKLKNRYSPLLLLIAVILALILQGCDGSEGAVITEQTSEGTDAEAVIEMTRAEQDETEETVEYTETEPEVQSETEPESLTETEPESEDEVYTEQSVGVTDISLSTYDVSIIVGQSKMPIVTMYPENATDKGEKWVSSDESVASVNWYGDILGVSEGECTVTVTSTDNPEVFATVNVKVTPDVECTYIDGILIVNKTYPLPMSYAPGNDQEAVDALYVMFAAAKEEGLTLFVKSGYRSYIDQKIIYNDYVARDGQSVADRYSARPGHSEHQSGLAFDLNSLMQDFGESPEGIWLAENCYKYGFIIRYPKDKEEITGYMYEPWHVRYLGIDTAEKVYESGLCLEEYLGITSSYS